MAFIKNERDCINVERHRTYENRDFVLLSESSLCFSLPDSEQICWQFIEDRFCVSVYTVTQSRKCIFLVFYYYY